MFSLTMLWLDSLKPKLGAFKISLIGEPEAYYGDYNDKSPVTNEETREFAACTAFLKVRMLLISACRSPDLTINPKVRLSMLTLTSDIVRLLMRYRRSGQRLRWRYPLQH